MAVTSQVGLRDRETGIKSAAPSLRNTRREMSLAQDLCFEQPPLSLQVNSVRQRLNYQPPTPGPYRGPNGPHGPQAAQSQAAS
jgi:hypothetical protein